MKKSLYKKLRDAMLRVINKDNDRLESIESEYLNSNNKYDKDEKVELYRWGKKMGDGIVTGTEFKDGDKLDTRPIINRVDEKGNKLKTLWWHFYNYDQIKRLK